MQTYTGHLAKMKTNHGTLVEYQLPLDQLLIPLNELLGRTVRIAFAGVIHCQNCGRKIKKTYDEGHCYPCTMLLACADMCIVRPELCHYAKGTCREPAWGLANCMTSHLVYLANSSGLKVGITREINIPQRWMDQGAHQALPILRVRTRLQSGQVETMFKDQVADKTDWRRMLSGEPVDMDLVAERERLLGLCAEPLAELRESWGPEAIEVLEGETPRQFAYPVQRYPKKISSVSLEKQAVLEGTLEGVKGQYLIFDKGVINIRKYTAYQVSVSF